MANAPYTILIGRIGVGKPFVMELIANVLHGNDVDHYNFDTIDPSNEFVGSPTRVSPLRTYEQKRHNGECQGCWAWCKGLTFFQGSRSRPHLGALTPAIFARRTPKEEYCKSDQGDPRLPFSSLSMTRSTQHGQHSLRRVQFFRRLPQTTDQEDCLHVTSVSNPLAWHFCQDTVSVILKNAP